eukprot:1657410-Prymnesium_polylepis.1
MRICDQQPMPKLDTTRYQLDPPPSSRQTDLAAWQKSIDNAQAQLEHQANRCVRARDQNNCTRGTGAHCNPAQPSYPRVGRRVERAACISGGARWLVRAERVHCGFVCRISNLELLQKHGANAWRAHLNGLEAASNRSAAALSRAPACAHDGHDRDHALDPRRRATTRLAKQTERAPRVVPCA